MKALIVDDEADVRYVARMSLDNIGHMSVIEAAGGEEGVARARRELPDVILLDMMMPGMDGPETFRALRSFEETASIPVVFLTARGMMEEVRRLTKLGAKGVVLKPFDPLTLASEITAILSS